MSPNFTITISFKVQLCLVLFSFHLFTAVIRYVLRPNDPSSGAVDLALNITFSIYMQLRLIFTHLFISHVRNMFRPNRPCSSEYLLLLFLDSASFCVYNKEYNIEQRIRC
jgi:hypothetical protein